MTKRPKSSISTSQEVEIDDLGEVLILIWQTVCNFGHAMNMNTVRRQHFVNNSQNEPKKRATFLTRILLNAETVLYEQIGLHYNNNNIH